MHLAVRIKFDKQHNIIQPTFVLSRRNGEKLGIIPKGNIQFSDSMNTYSDLSFRVQREMDGNKCAIWDEIVDFKLMWCKEWDEWFEIYVEISESNSAIKNISAISLGEAELSQIMLYDIEINTETDISRDDYDANYPTILYRDDPLHKDSSLLDRIMEKAPHYTIKHVDLGLKASNRVPSFTFDGISLYDAFQEISEEYNCIFVINSGTNSGGKIAREISIYDLESYCLTCGCRDTYFKTCPDCGGTNVLTGYGEDTNIFISVDNLAEEITYSTDTDSVKNCFKLEAGDDLMTATVINCNPNGSGYIWYRAPWMDKDMSPELVSKLDEYDNTYNYYQYDYECVLNTTQLTKYNNLVSKYHSYNEDITTISNSIVGYPALMTAYYNTIDFYLYLKSGLMPSVSMQNTSAIQEASSLISALPKITVAVQNLESCSSATASSSVLSMAKVLVDSRYQVKVVDGVLSNNIWTGNFIITNYSDDDDTATTSNISVKINDNYEYFVKQKIQKALSKEQSDDVTDIVSLFELSLANFTTEIKKYCLASLNAFRDACQTCLDILIEQGVADKETWVSESPDLYTEIYLSYYNKNTALLKEISLREDEIAIIIGDYNNEGKLETVGLQNLIEDEQARIQEILNFEKFLGSELWLDFIAYRREDTYSNDNYISDGLDNAEIFNRALEFIETAKKEIYKSATLQHSITATLKNLLVMKEFEPILDYFSVGNWIRVKINDEIYRLRLLSYTIDFENLDNISIEFSDVMQCSNGANDVESVLEQAASMTTSYSSVSRQATKGKNSKEQLENWVEKGLALTTMQIINDADSQNITWDSHGLLCREYLPLTDEYDDKQLKIINKGVYLTDNNWLTSKAGIGNFNFWNPMTGQVEESYGVIADTLVGNLILSEKVGIYNTQNSITLDENGLIITTDYDESNGNTNNMAFTIQKKTIDTDGNESVEKLLYINDEGDLVLNGSLYISSSVKSGTLDDVLDIDINTDDIYETIYNTASETTETLSKEFKDALDSTTNTINTSINKQYNTIMEEINDELAAHKAEVGQYLKYDPNIGLTLGATSSNFSTIIDNSGMYFKESGTTVAYINNKLLYIPDAVIQNSLTLGNFFFSPRSIDDGGDGGVSLVWKTT